MGLQGNRAPHLQPGLFRQNRPHGSGACGLESPRARLQRPVETVLECHDPTQGNQQGNDTGSQYRSAIYTFNPQHLQRPWPAKTPIRQPSTPRATGPSPRKFWLRPFISPRTTTSNIWPNQAAAYCSAMPADAAWRPVPTTCSSRCGKVRLVDQSLHAPIRQRPHSARQLNQACGLATAQSAQTIRSTDIPKPAETNTAVTWV